MKKKLILTSAIVLCLAVLLSSCGIFGPKAKLGSIVNTEWVSPEDEANRVLGAGERISFENGYFVDKDTDASDRYVAYVKTDSVTELDTIEIYDLKMSISTPMLSFTDKSEATDVATVTKETRHIVDISQNYVSVLTVVYDYDRTLNDNYYFSSGSYYKLYVNFLNEDYVPSNTRLNSASSSNELGATYTLSVYGGSSATPIETVPSETLAEWEYNSVHNYNNYFVDKYEAFINELGGNTIGADLLLKGTKLYRVDDNGNETLIRDMGLNAVPEDIIGETDKYYVAAVIDGSYIRSCVYYDKDLNYVTHVNIPSYGSPILAVHVMNNGNLLYQTQKNLPDDAKKYDFISRDYLQVSKFQLDTYMVDIETGKTKELDFDFIIRSVYNTYVSDAENDFWSEDIENIAIVSRIDDDKVIDQNEASCDWVSISNKGREKGSVKFMDDLVEIPVPYGEDGYFCSVDVCDNIVVLDKEGNAVARINQENAETKYKYIVKDDVIYDLLGNKVFDKNEGGVDSFEIVADGVFITRKDTATETTYRIYVDGQEKKSYTVQEDNLLAERVADFGIALGGNAYYVHTVKLDLTAPNTYDYYNLNGELIGSYSTKLYYEFTGEDCVVARTLTSLGENEFYKFSFN